jgi:molybdopterin molybdotransferase
MPSPVPTAPPSVEEARRLMCAIATATRAARADDGSSSPEVEDVPLGDSLHRVLAEPLIAPRAQPPYRSSAMDGFALRLEGLEPAAGLEVIGEAAAGNPWPGTVGPQQAVRIFTGAPVPAGATAVIAQERTRRADVAAAAGPGRAAGPGEPVYLDPEATTALALGTHIRAIGADFSAGAELLAAGTRLHARHLALIAAAGFGSLRVRRRPRIALLANGNELRAPGEPAGAFEIYDSVTPGLGAMIAEWGGTARRAGTTQDSALAIEAAARRALEESDLLVIVGGASVGDYDLVKRGLAAVGLDLAVSSISVRPGKPTWFGTLPAPDAKRALPVLGLPGNPAAAFVCAQLFLRPLIDTLLGATSASRVVTAALEGRLPATGAQAQYLRASARVSPDARLVVRPDPRQDTSLVSVYAHANALIRRPPHEPGASWGSFVEVLLLGSL